MRITKRKERKQEANMNRKIASFLSASIKSDTVGGFYSHTSLYTCHLSNEVNDVSTRMNDVGT